MRCGILQSREECLSGKLFRTEIPFEPSQHAFTHSFGVSEADEQRPAILTSMIMCSLTNIFMVTRAGGL